MQQLEMKERPILFSAPMVREVLPGQKTMTRRVVKQQPGDHHWSRLKNYSLTNNILDASDGLYVKFIHWIKDRCDEPIWSKCPYGRVGDRLWVRETWKTYAAIDHLSPREIAPGAGVEYAAGGTNIKGQERLHGMGKSRPSIFMPRWASRINLEITGIGVERLQDITEADSKKEGVIELPFAFQATTEPGPTHDTAKDAFQYLWDSINGKTPGKSWDDNPYVWAVSFKKLA